MKDDALILFDGRLGREPQRQKPLQVKTIWAGFALGCG